MADRHFARRALGLLVLGIVAFTVYGSLVPFDYHSRPWAEVVAAFRWAMTNRWWIESRSDGIANVMLGIPLGFGLLGFLQTGRSTRKGDALLGVALLPACLAFAAAVEFAQLYVPERTCSGSDVLCQGLGAVLGMAGWVIAGRWLMAHAEAAWNGAEPASRLLVAYLVLLAFIQLLPMDLTASPRDLYRKLRDDVVYVPFSELTGEATWGRTARLLQVFGLFVPVGLLARQTARLPPIRVVLVAVALAVGMEALQLIVKSRVPSATDSAMGTVGAVFGWIVAARFRWSLAVLWFAGLAFISWQPFELVADPPLPFDWIPGLPLERGNPLFALEEMLTKCILFGLGGALLRPSDSAGSNDSIRQAAVLGLVVSAIFEVGQTAFAQHSPCITDVLLGALGAAIGCRLAGSTLTDPPQVAG